MNVPQRKTDLRDQIGKRISEWTSQEKEKQSTVVCQRISSLLPSAVAGLCAYFPLPDEVDIRPVLEEILARGIPLFLPRFDNQEVTFHRVTALEELRPGTFGIPGPAKDNPEPDPATVTLVLVPGRAFDSHGNRLGRGKAGYDRWIKKQRQANPKTLFWGIAFAEQIVDEVPTEEHDERMDIVLSPEGIIDADKTRNEET